jgi:hypothetical protein
MSGNFGQIGQKRWENSRQNINREPEEWQTISNTPRRSPQPIIQAAQEHMVYGAHRNLAIAREVNHRR